MSKKKTSDRLADFIHCYYDQDCIKELIIDAAGKPFLQIPKVTDAGKEGSTVMYIVNRFEHDFHVENIDVLDEDMEVRVEETVLRHDRPVKINVFFRPNKNRLTPLNTYFVVRGRYIMR